jgi:hypothetical protein
LGIVLSLIPSLLLPLVLFSPFLLFSHFFFLNVCLKERRKKERKEMEKGRKRCVKGLDQ